MVVCDCLNSIRFRRKCICEIIDKIHSRNILSIDHIDLYCGNFHQIDIGL
uniref:Uncharacterized protein n=1 Tax=Megaselia scalaris TaxID=36166 RepID=T1GTZ8_MEGSC